METEGRSLTAFNDNCLGSRGYITVDGNFCYRICARHEIEVYCAVRASGYTRSFAVTDNIKLDSLNDIVFGCLDQLGLSPRFSIKANVEINGVF